VAGRRRGPACSRWRERERERENGKEGSWGGTKKEEKEIICAHNGEKMRGNTSNSDLSEVSKTNSKELQNRVFTPRWPTPCMLQGSWITSMTQQLSRASTYSSMLPYSSMKKISCHPCPRAKAAQDLVECLGEGTEDRMEATRIPKSADSCCQPRRISSTTSPFGNWR